LLEANANCHVPCTSDAKSREFPHRSNPRLRLVTTGSLADEEAVARLYEGVPDLWASIHIAGGFASGRIAEIDRAGLMRQIEMNFVTCFLCCRAAVAAMRQGKTGGRIVNVAARPGLEWRGASGMTAYGASKAAVAALTAALAEEVVKEGILVNAVVPSTMDTPANRASMPKAHYENWPKVEEVAETILFLASPENRVTRGALVPVYGRS
jgi:NAD(P)-dependent dehydrogenase (short-subunit alcohol dehydrogenase family)